MMSRYLIWVLLVLCGFNSKAQQDNIWAFGLNAGLDFNTKPPSPITTSLSTYEGSASICDESGKMLFYTDGTSVWDRNNQLMPNGDDLPGVGFNITSSTSQGALIVPIPEVQNKYYIFSLGNLQGLPAQSPYMGKLYYSIVDVNLNNGLGDIVPGNKGILLDTFLMEQMTAVTGNHCNVWFLAVSRDSIIKAYNIDRNGIGVNPVLSTRISGEYVRSGNDYLGNMIVSPDRSKLVISKGNLVLYNFDAESGKVSNPVVLENTFYFTYYGAAFSSDNTKLYVSSSSVRGLSQYDVIAPSPDALLNSRTTIAEHVPYGMRLGPDGKIYIAHTGQPYLHVINTPNLKGPACDFIRDGLALNEETRVIWGMPNYPTIVKSRTVVRVISDTVFCKPSHLLTPAYTTGWNYVWDDGSTNTNRLVDQPGTYWVKYEANPACLLEHTIDTIKVYFDNSRKLIRTTIPSMGLCPEDTVLLKATYLKGTDYLWLDGIKGNQRIVNHQGTYVLSYKQDSLCRDYEDHFLVTYADPKVSFITDTIICQQETVSFSNTSDVLFKHFEWSFGDLATDSAASPEHIYHRPGRYKVSLIGIIDVICQDTISMNIEVDSLLFNTFSADRNSICAGETIHFSPQRNSASISKLHWDLGNMVIDNMDNGVLQHAFDSAGTLAVHLYTHFRACPTSSYTDTVRIFPLPIVDLGPDTAFCNKGEPLVLSNLTINNEGNYHLLWSTGDTTATSTVKHHGTYSLTVSQEPMGCSSTESIVVGKDCYIDIPNGFTPNGDGINDYFFPRQLLSQNLTAIHIQIFNRWGQIMFEASSLHGLGWDGKFNGKDQPQAAYIYRIAVTLQERQIETSYVCKMIKIGVFNLR